MTHAEAAPTPPVSAFFVTGGTLSVSAASYVPRQADTDLFENLLAGEYCYVLNSRQMGKSSLCVRTMERLRHNAVRTVFLDLTRFGGLNVTPEQWYLGLVSETGRALGLRKEFLAFWKERQDYSLVERFFGAIREVALEPLTEPLAIFVDEIDITRSLPFSTDEFFSAIRACYVGRATDMVWKRLVFCLLGTATPAELIQDTRTSPFNIGRRIEVRDFTAEEAAPLAQGLALSAQHPTPNAQRLLDRVLYWTHGHPYLTQRLCRSVAEASDADVDRICTDLFLTHAAKESDDNLAFVRNRLLRSEADLASLLDLYRRMQQGRRVPDDETNPLASVLKLSGVVRVENGLLTVRNRIYDRVFDSAWITAHMPGAELRRQKEAYRKGSFRALAGSAAVLAVVIGLAVYAFSQVHRANQSTRRADANAQRLATALDNSERTSYFAAINLAQREYENNNVGRALNLLEETKISRYRGFEWDYINRLCHLERLTLRGHTDSVSSVAYSPDGKRIVTGSADKTAKVWDAATGKELLTLKGHSGAVIAVTYSLDGHRIATGSDDNTARIWDAATGNEVLTLEGHTNSVKSLAFSPDGRRIVTGSGDNTAKVWDTETGRELLILHGHTGPVQSVAYSRDGRRIVTGSEDHTAKVWNVATGKQILTLGGQKNRIRAVDFSPDGQRILTGSQDHTARIWDARTGTELLTLTGHTHLIFSAAFSSNGQRILTGSMDGTVEIWDAATGIALHTVSHLPFPTSAALSPDGQSVVTGSLNGTANIWGMGAVKDSLALGGHAAGLNNANFSSDGRRIVTGSQDGTATIWDAETGHTLHTFNGHTEEIWSAAFSPNDRRIITSGTDEAARVWSVQTGEELLTIKGHKSKVFFAGFSPNGKWIVTCSVDGTAKLWDAATGKELRAFKGHRKEINDTEFSPDGRYIVTASNDGTAIVWSVQTGMQQLTLRGHSDQIWSASYSSDGKFIATASLDGTARVWNSTTGQVLVILRGHAACVISAAFSPDGKRIVTGSQDNTAKLWDSQTGRELLTLRGHTNWVMSAAFSPDGKRILTASQDGTARIWFSDRAD